MSKSGYEPSFLISAQVPEELHAQIADYAKSKGISEEEAYREALSFFAARCVHTPKARRKQKR